MSPYRDLDALHKELAAKEAAIRARLADFRKVGQGDDEALFEELCFAILAIQSSARSSDAAVRAMVDRGLLRTAGPEEMARFLSQLYNREVTLDSTVTAIHFSEILHPGFAAFHPG